MTEEFFTFSHSLSLNVTKMPFTPSSSIQLWALDYVEEEEELRRRKSSSRRGLALSDSDFDPTIHGDKHLPVVQNLKRSASPPALQGIKEGMFILSKCDDDFLVVIVIATSWTMTYM